MVRKVVEIEVFVTLREPSLNLLDRVWSAVAVEKRPEFLSLEARSSPPGPDPAARTPGASTRSGSWSDRGRPPEPVPSRSAGNKQHHTCHGTVGRLGGAPRNSPPFTGASSPAALRNRALSQNRLVLFRAT